MTKLIDETVSPGKISIRDYQQLAYVNWMKNAYSGIFAMATGTGKTVTALNCIYQEYLKSSAQGRSYYHILVLVPTQPLVSQWVAELGKWGFDRTFIASGKSNWRTELQQLANDFKLGVEDNFAIVATYSTFSHAIFQNLINFLPEDTILIADEAHNMGQAKARIAFENFPFKKRIGLSATPKRIYDLEGTSYIETFFNDVEPYCFSFSMDDAIAQGRLCRYDYFPEIVELSKEELKEYIVISKKIIQIANSSKAGILEDNSIIESLLLKRKRIINKAEGKIKALSNIISKIKAGQKVEFCFTYVSGGDIKNEFDDDDKRIIREMQKVFQDEVPGIKTHTYLGETKGREEILDGFEKGEIDVLLAINCLDEGVDLPRTGIGIFTSSTGNPRQYIQRRGRVLRNHPDKYRALIYDMIVIPQIFGESKDSEFYRIERSLVRNELQRVGYFAKLSENFYEGRKALEPICKYYQLDLDTIINEL